MSDDIMQGMKTQSDEFAALAALSRAHARLPPIVDDDYPEQRHYFESALATFIAAMAANSRFVIGNRYHIYSDVPQGKSAEHPALAAIKAEIAKATAKFPTWPTDPLHALGVLAEEKGELDKAVLQQVYEPHKNSANAVRVEAIQCAAMAVRFVMSLDTYQYAPGVQHKQDQLP